MPTSRLPARSMRFTLANTLPILSPQAAFHIYMNRQSKLAFLRAPRKSLFASSIRPAIMHNSACAVPLTPRPKPTKRQLARMPGLPATTQASLQSSSHHDHGTKKQARNSLSPANAGTPASSIQRCSNRAPPVPNPICLSWARAHHPTDFDY